MTPLFAICLALLAWELVARRGPFAGLRLPIPAFERWVVVSAAFVLVAAFAGQIALSDYQSTHDGIRPAWLALAPLHLVDDAYRFGPRHLVFSLSAFGLVALQAGALFVVAAGCAQPNAPASLRVVPWLTGGALAALAVASPALTSGDVFGYVGLGMLGTHAFERPAGFFHGQFAAVFAGYPIRPTIYGPLWIAVNAGVVGLGSSFLAKIVALRIFGAALLGALVLVVRALGGGRAAQYALALNPMLWLQFVVNAHNDLLAVVLIVAALLALQRRLLWVAVFLVAAAGTVKLPLILLGVFVFARSPERRTALLAAGASIVIAGGLSTLLGGHAYLDALVATGRGRAHWMPDGAFAKAAGIAIACSATVAGLAFRRFSGFAGWFYPSLSPLIFPWYFAWVIPYGCVVGAGLFETLVALPVVAVLSDTIYALDLVSLALAVPIALWAVLRLLRRAPAALTA